MNGAFKVCHKAWDVSRVAVLKLEIIRIAMFYSAAASVITK